MLEGWVGPMTTPAHPSRYATVTIPARRPGPPCARPGCRHGAWFAIHHVPVCSSECADQIARMDAVTRARLPVARAVRWHRQGHAPWTLVIASGGRDHDFLRAWWWMGQGIVARGGSSGWLARWRGEHADILTDTGLFTFLRRLVRRGATELRPWRIAGWSWEHGESAPPWTDIALPQEPIALAKRLVQAANRVVRRRERVRALRARYRQRGTSHDGTTAHAARVA
jgi:hypothetical protein